ncbi:hypothetical protein T265_15474, partial [Opisthorchis viverrini]
VFQHGLLFLCICLADSLVSPSIQFDLKGPRVQQNRSFTIDPNTHTFLKDGAQFQYIAGSFHYFRIPTLYWRDRLEKAKAAGLDAIQLYIPWNFHEPEEGEYNFADDRDLEYFLDIIRQLDMLAIVRAGPYICAEWAFGGLPPWLLRKNPNMKIRSSDPAYYQEVVKWFNVLLPKLRKHLYTRGGPIVMVQMENEYGSYGLCDRTYMTDLYDLARSHLGEDVILFTTDGCALGYLRCGVLDPRYLATIDFGPTTNPPDVSFSSVEKFRPGQPLLLQFQGGIDAVASQINSEFYSGWFDGWGGKHARTGAEFVRNSLMNLMKYSKRVNVNMYMFHGGTNFGLWNGKPVDVPAITSYDYDAPISEAGDVTYKYELLQKAIFEFRNRTPPPLPKNTTKKAYGSIQLHRTSHLLLGFGVRIPSRYPLNMESLHQYEGFTIYYVKIPGAPTDVELTLANYRDLAHIFTADDQLACVRWRGLLDWPRNTIRFDLRDSLAQTHIVLLLENTGYVNYGRGMYNNIKGLLGNVTLNGQILCDWVMIPLKSPLETNEIDFPQGIEKLPEQGSVYSGELLIQDGDQPEDTFIEPGGFSRLFLQPNWCYFIEILLYCLLVWVFLNGSLGAPSNQFDVEQPISAAERSFTIDPSTYTFLKDGVPFQYISGSFHYFRIPTMYWSDRLKKAKAAGLDAIQIYIPWNFHEPEEGEYNFSDDRDVEHFLDLIQQLDMLAIVRVGPYICAEWAFGGLPPWLLRKNPTMKLRSSDYSYYREVVKWFGVLLPKLRRHLYTEGGPIIMVQLENEYGYTKACDRDYMSMLYDLARYHLGQKVILFTTDGNSLQILRCGSPDQRYLATIDFAPIIGVSSSILVQCWESCYQINNNFIAVIFYIATIPPNVSFDSVEKFRPGQPLVNSEFYTGWYDTWGSEHAHRSAELVQESLIDLMNYSPRVNVNIYVFHGGTSFGFWSGKPKDVPATTSYDFDAPLSEAGDMTYKYELLRKAIHKFRSRPLPPLPKNSTKKAYGEISMKLISHLLLQRGPKVESPVAMSMELLRQYDGFVMYCATIPAGKSELNVTLTKFADIAHVFTSDGGLEMFCYEWRLMRLDDLLFRKIQLGSRYDVVSNFLIRHSMQHWHGNLKAPNNKISLYMRELPSHTKLMLLLENTGYVNFGELMWNNIKGLLGTVTANNQILGPWEMMPIKPLVELDQRAILKHKSDDLPVQGAIFTGDLTIPEASDLADTFIEPVGFSRGFAAVNNHLLGHFDQNLGPQLRLYVPKQFLTPGQNRIIVCELQTLLEPTPKVWSFAETKWTVKAE